MFDSKLRVEKVEMVKRIIRQNNYHQYEKTHTQCVELGLNVNRPALDRFANKLELIDKAELSKRQYQLHQIEVAKHQALEEQKQKQSQKLAEFADTSQQVQAKPKKLVRRKIQAQAPRLQEMTYEQVKQREEEITFALGELKIRENELLQELISLSELLDNKQIN